VHVCEGVQHAHQKAIIHRDLKPSNILVSEVDGQAAPKIIDFGVAKALAQRLTAATLYTRVGTLVGTPEYMSPEQATSSGEDIDTRTDVYSLGVIFYELLAGMPPLDLKKRALDEFLRRLRDEEPPKPSTRIRTLDPGTATELARKRQTEPMALAKQLGGDLDSIALRALEKDRARRYASAAGLAADIRRHLRDEPIAARPPSVSYQLQKFVRRHKTLVIGVAAVFVVLVLGVLASTWEAVQARRAEAKAKQQSAIAQAVNDFLQNDVLAQASAYNQSKPDPHLEVRTALDRAAARITGKFDREPEVEASIRNTIGTTYNDLGLYPEAAKQLERALDLRRRALGPQHPDTLRSMNSLAQAYIVLGKTAQAEALESQTLQIMRRVLGPENPDTLNSMFYLAVIYIVQGKSAQAEALHNQTLEIRRRVLGPEHPDTLDSMSALAADYSVEGKYAQAEALGNQILEIERRVLGPEHPDTLASMHNLAYTYRCQGNYAQAETLGSQVLEIRRRVMGPEHENTLAIMDNLAEIYGDEGKYTEAEALLNQTLAIERRVLASEVLVSSTLLRFAFIYQREGEYDLAQNRAEQALAGFRHSLGAENPDTNTMASEADLALAYVSQGRFAQSEPLAREALEGNKKIQPDNWQRFRAASLLGASLAGEKKYAEAEPLLLEGYQGMLARKERIAVPDRYHLELAHQWLVRLYQAWGKPDKAVGWRKKSDR
jgi:tetratricopeptide (TPR) repeat protein